MRDNPEGLSRRELLKKLGNEYGHRFIKKLAAHYDENRARIDYDLSVFD